MSIKIDKSKFTPRELNTYKALIAKATVDPEAAEDEMEKELPEELEGEKKPEVEVEEETVEEEKVETEKCDTKKSANPQITAALERLETLEKSLAMQEYTEIAKKYAVLGEDEEELAKTLYDMRKSSEENYEAYIDVLEKSLNIVEKSGIFAEIGKSGAAYGANNDVVGKIETYASELRKSHPEMTYSDSITKAWDENPELVAEYDKTYKK